MDINDLPKPFAVILSLGVAAGAGFLAGYIVGRDPEKARRLVRSIAGGLTRTQVVVAETVEQLGDLWADARAQARRDIDDERFEAEPGGVAAGVVAAAAQADSATPGVKSSPAGASRTRRPRTPKDRARSRARRAKTPKQPARAVAGTAAAKAKT
jgi:hypothetical protein